MIKSFPYVLHDGIKPHVSIRAASVVAFVVGAATESQAQPMMGENDYGFVLADFEWLTTSLFALVVLQAAVIGGFLFWRTRRRQRGTNDAHFVQSREARRKQVNSLFSNVPAIVWEAEVDETLAGRKTIFISDYVEKMLGYTAEEWMSAPSGFGLSLMPEADRIAAKQTSQKVIATGRDGTSQFRWRTKDGRLIWAESYLNPILDDQGKVRGLRGVTIDITKRKATEAALRDSENRLSRAQQAARVGTWEWHIPSGEAVWSEMIWELLGLTPEADTSVNKFVASIHPDDRDRVLRHVDDAIRAGDDYYDEFRVVRPDGTVLWLSSKGRVIRSADGSPERIHGVIIDITKHKEADQSVRHAEQKHQAILKAIPDLMFLQTPDGTYLDYYAKDPRDLWAPPETFLGKNMREVLPPKLAQALADAFARAEEMGEPQIVEYKLSLHETDRWFEARIVRSGEDIVSVVRDISERKRAIDELRRSEERFSKSFRGNPQPMALTAIADGRYIDVNDSFLAITGYTREEVIGHTSIELGIWETPERRADFVKQIFEKGAVVNLEEKVRTKSGELRLLLLSAERLEIGGEDCLLIASSDITERMKAQQALRESEARFRNMADTTPVMIWMADQSKLCTYFNKQWLDFTGRSLDQEYGNGWAAGVHADDYEQCLAIYQNSFEARQGFEMEYRLRRFDGEYRWIFDKGTPRFSPDGEFLGYIGSCSDITDLKQGEIDLRAAHEQLSRLTNQLEAENAYLQQELRPNQFFPEIVGTSKAIQNVHYQISIVAPTDSTVLISGETGTGKELVACAIHEASARKSQPLVKVNCAAFSAPLVESELFGHEKGSFTGAVARRLGRFELAEGGTIFLDEIGELPLELQPKLLRVIQEGEFERVGSTKTLKVNVRVIAATNRELKQEVDAGRFREDLWYRLNVFPIVVPPLRQRQSDIPLLLKHFVDHFARKFGTTITEISPQTVRYLNSHSWPGNVRELANAVERAVINAQGSTLRLAEFVGEFHEPDDSTTMEAMERQHIRRVLQSTGWKIEGPNGAAKVLGLNASTLRTRMRKLGIHREREQFTSKAASD